MIAMGYRTGCSSWQGPRLKELLSEEALRYEITASRDMVKNALGIWLFPTLP